MTSLISLLVVGALATLLAVAALGLGAVVLGAARGRQMAPAPGAAPSQSVGLPPSFDADMGNGLVRRVAGQGLAVGLVLLLGALLARTILVGHAPWSNLHEFSLAFAAALLGTHLLLARAHPMDGLAPLTALLAAGLVGFALALDDRVDPLVPALQQPILLTAHVGSAALAYAVSGVAFLAATAEIGQARAGDRIPLLPPAAVARAISHRAVLVAFPVLTVAIVLGSVWANLAWRSYWSNDPKELAAAATWLVFGAYLHVAGRRDRWGAMAPWLIVLGFAGVLFTYLGAGLVFVGEHSYAAP
jgi:ABC-type transport system involved in cytochrome c biogenesis permease subunit